MTKQDFPEFAQMWQSVHNNMNFGKVYDESGLMFVFEIIEEYPLQAIQQAVKVYARQNSTAPQPSDIVKIIAQAYGNEHLAPDEAWGRFPKEITDSAMVSVEMLRAWDSADLLYKQKQFFAAEKAFKTAYTREVAESNAQGRTLKMQLTQGTDKAQLKAVVEAALAKGQLPQEYAQSILQALPAPITNDGLLLIGSKKADKSNTSQKMREKLAEMKALLDDKDKEEKDRRDAENLAAERIRRDKEDAAMALLPPDQQIALRSANLERYGNEVLH